MDQKSKMTSILAIYFELLQNQKTSGLETW